MILALLQRAKASWQPKPVEPPRVDADLGRMNAVERATESLRYALLRWECWASPSGDIREWLRQNTRIAAWLFIPALFVMPVIGLILWQVSGWLTLLTSVAGKLIVLPVLILLACVVIRIVVALFKR